LNGFELTILLMNIQLLLCFLVLSLS